MLTDTRRGQAAPTPSAPSPLPVVGTSLPRVDGPSKVTGRARYVDDFAPEGCLYGATLRSTRAHARILAVEPDPAFDWTGITICTAKDIPGENLVYLMTEDQPVLCDGLTRHVAEAVALVAAPTRDRATEALQHLRVTYEDLPALLDPLVAEGHAVRIFGEDNVFKRIHIDKLPEGGPVEEEGLIIVEGTYTVGLQEQLYIEPQGMLALPRADGGLTLLGSMQCPFYIDKALKRVLGHERFNVVQAATGGGFGGKEEYPSMIAAHAAILAVKTGRPVKLVYRRDEDLRATTKRHPAVIHLRTASTPAGATRKLEARIVVDGGAYNTLTPVVLSRAVLHVTGPYRADEVHLDGVAVATNTPPNGAFRGFGAPQALFAAERHIDAIARRLGRSPVELRRQLLYRDGDRSATGQLLTDTGAAAVFEEALAAAEAPLLPSPPDPGGAGRRLARGRGVSLVFHGCGFTGNGEAWLKGKAGLALEGDRVRVLSSSTDIGQGAETTFVQIAADELGLAADRFDMSPHDTALVPDSGPTVASRTCMVVGHVIQEAARKLRAALQAETGLADERDFDRLLAARRSAAPLRVEHTYEDDGSMRWDADLYQGDAYPTFGWAACVVDLDVDIDTGEVIYRRLVSATDVGRAINPVIVTGQIEGGSVQGLGYATSEEVVLDDQGGMRNNRLTNYIIPTTIDAPEMITRLVEIPYRRGPFGAKGVGEIPVDGPAPAVAQAIEAAVGVTLDRLPMTPERVLAALSLAPASHPAGPAAQVKS